MRLERENMEFDPKDRKEQEPLQGEVIKQSASNDQSKIDEVVTSLRLLTGGAPTKVQDAKYSEVVHTSSYFELKTDYELPSKIVESGGLPPVDFVRNLMAKRRDQRQQTSDKKAA